METQRIKALKISDVDQKKIKLLVTKKNKKVPIVYDQEPFVFQTPFLEMTTDKIRPTAYPGIHQLDTLFSGNSKSKVDTFYQFIEAIESNICAQVGKSCVKWFGQKEITFKSLIRESDLNKNMFYIKWPVELDKDMLVSEDGDIFNPKNLKEKDFVKFIVEIPNIWIDGERLGLACIVKKVMVKQHKEKITNEYVFDSSSESSSDDVLNLHASESSVDKITKVKINNRIPEVEIQIEPLRSKKVVQVKKEFPQIPALPKKKVTFADPPNENEFDLLTDEAPQNNAHQSLKVELISHKKFQQQKKKHVVVESDEEFSEASSD
uniref:Uncharacterized protein n=1 Tax=viral metagenome TaxID=1070528 RepID=A0A6C0CB02_9ZZZZ